VLAVAVVVFVVVVTRKDGMFLPLLVIHLMDAYLSQVLLLPPYFPLPPTIYHSPFSVVSHFISFNVFCSCPSLMQDSMWILL
jgi:hypothetical protein